MPYELGRGNGWTVERYLLVLTFISSIAGFSFSVGLNWAKLTQHQVEIERLHAFDAAVTVNYVPRELYNVQQKSLSEAIERLTITLQEIQRDGDYRQSRTPNPGRSFDK